MNFKRILWFLLNLSLILGLMFILPSPSITQTKDSGKVYKVAILPFLIHSQENLDYVREGIYDILSSRITSEGKIVVIERSAVERAFYEERPMRLDETVAKQIGARVGADYIILGSLTKIGDYISLDARLISITEERPPLGAYTQHKGIDDVMLKIGDFAQDIGYKILGRSPMAGRPTQPQSPYRQQRRETGRIAPEGPSYKKSQIFNFEIKGLDIGDVDGDKKNEVVVMDKHDLYVFKYDGETLKLFQKIELGSHHNFLTLDVADVNQNGYAEIIVTSVVGDNLQSFILEFEEGKFTKVIERADWYFRVLDHPKDGPLLIGQKMGSEGIPVGPIYKFLWKKKSFEKGPKMDFPKETNIFGLALADVRNKGTLDVVTLNESDQLRIQSADGKYTWTSKPRFGGTDNSYDTKKKKEPGSSYKDALDLRVYIRGRILIKDLNGDGINELIINANNASSSMFRTGRVRSFESAQIYDLVWEDGNLATLWKTREINGYIADYQVKDVDNDGDEELVVAVVDFGGITDRKGTSTILFFKLF
jgi:TolB-like protein